MTSIKSEKPIARCFDDEDGKEFQTAYIHGYHFGDRQLEGVFFRCDLDDEGILEVGPVDPRELHGLDVPYWLGAALDYAIKNDIFFEHPDGSDGGDLAFKDPVEEPEPAPPPKVVKVMKADAFTAVLVSHRKSPPETKD